MIYEKCKIFVCVGTRPEIIKMSSIIHELKNDSLYECFVCSTGQHKELLDFASKELNINFDCNLNIMKHNQSLAYAVSEVTNRLDEVIKKIKPHFVIVHGDTATCLGCALCAFYNEIKIIYVEAGWRSYNFQSPFPEEMHRVLVSQLANYFLCTNDNNRQVLLNEGKNPNDVFVLGNPAEDVLHYTVNDNYTFSNNSMREMVCGNNRVITITFHRRENYNKVIELFNIIKNVSLLMPDMFFLWVYHPKILEIITKDICIGLPVNFKLIEPLSIGDMHNLLYRSSVVLTDSGGVQEETYIINTPTLILRNVTERSMLLGDRHKLITINEKNIYDSICEFLELETGKRITSNYKHNAVGKKAKEIIKEIFNQSF